MQQQFVRLLLWEFNGNDVFSFCRQYTIIFQINDELREMNQFIESLNIGSLRNYCNWLSILMHAYKWTKEFIVVYMECQKCGECCKHWTHSWMLWIQKYKQTNKHFDAFSMWNWTVQSEKKILLRMLTHIQRICGLKLFHWHLNYCYCIKYIYCYQLCSLKPTWILVHILNKFL